MGTESNMYESGRNANTLYDRANKYIQNKYSVRYNEISIQFQIKTRKSTKWSILNLNSLHIELEQVGIVINIAKLEILLKSHLIEKYNPIEGYFKSLEKWDEINHIKDLCNYIKTDDDEVFYYHFEKWLTRAVLCSLVDGRVNKQCLVFTSPSQNIGKTTFFRFLVPNKLRDFYVEDIGTDKDSLIKLSKNFIINMDELNIQGQNNLNALKAYISKTHINERLPYGKRQERLERISSFVGSTNETDILKDETGNVRWLIFEVKDINFDYTSIDIDKVWAQAYHNAFIRKGYNPELSKEDVTENEKRNEQFKFWTDEKRLIDKYLQPSEMIEDFMTATDVMILLQHLESRIKLNSVKIGSALKSLSFLQSRQKGDNRARGYLVKRRF